MPAVCWFAAITYSNERTLLGGPVSGGLGRVGAAGGGVACVTIEVALTSVSVALAVVDPPAPVQLRS